MDYIVTVKFRKSPDHDPKNKKTGACVLSSHCTDVTGQHHSALMRNTTEEQIHEDMKPYDVNITRIELVS